MLDQDEIQAHAEALDTTDKAACQNAIRALLLCKPESWAALPDRLVRTVINSLVRLLATYRDEKAKGLGPLRLDAITLLGNIGPRAAPAIPQFLDLLDNGVALNLREACVTTLAKIGPEAVSVGEKLVDLLGDQCPPPLVAHVACALADIEYRGERVHSALRHVWLVCIGSPESRAQLALAICRLQLDVPGLLKTVTGNLVSSPNPSLRKLAVEALAWRSEEELDVVPALATALYDEDEEVRRLAHSALGRMKLTPDRSLQVCVEQLQESLLAETALRKAGAPAVVVLGAALEAEDPRSREKAARTLGAIGEESLEAVPALTKLLRDGDMDVRLAVAKALWNITKDPKGVVPALAELLTTEWLTDPEAADMRRKYVQTIIEALSRIGPLAKAAVPSLIAKTTDDNRLIREAAVRALKEIDPGAASQATSR